MVGVSGQGATLGRRIRLGGEPAAELPYSGTILSFGWDLVRFPWRREVCGPPDEAANLDKWLGDQEAIINVSPL